MFFFSDGVFKFLVQSHDRNGKGERQTEKKSERKRGSESAKVKKKIKRIFHAKQLPSIRLVNTNASLR